MSGKSKTAPSVLVNLGCITGENPYWHPDEKRVYWVDIPRGQIMRHAPGEARTEVFAVGAPVGGFTVQEDGSLLLFMAGGAVAVWREGRMEYVFESLPGEEKTRFNDVIADPEGRVFCGTMGTPERSGRLYRLDPDLKITLMFDGVGVSNGMGFSPDLRRMYYTDTHTGGVDIFEYDRATGSLADRRVFAKAEEGAGRPDGLTVDKEGCVWSARWGGARLVRYDPDGRRITEVMFPVNNVSSAAFGGKRFETIYVTTAGGDRVDLNGRDAGAVFAFDPGVCGVPEFRSRIRPRRS